MVLLCALPRFDLCVLDRYISLIWCFVFCVNTKLPCYCNLCLAWDLFLIALLDAACGRWKGRIMTAVSSTSFSFLLLFPVRNTFCFDYTGSSLSSTSSTSLLFCPCVTFCDDQYNHTGWWQLYYLFSTKSFLSLICFFLCMDLFYNSGPDSFSLSCFLFSFVAHCFDDACVFA